MNIGIIARADNGGLANQTYEMCRHFMPIKTLLVHGLTGRQEHFERYPGAITATNPPIDHETIDDFLKGLDLVLTVETPYGYYLFKKAKELGIKSVLQYNYEFLDYFNDPSLPYPDLLLAPSKWHIKDVEKTFGQSARVEYLPVPVNREVLPFKKKKKCRTFVHVAGTTLHEDRNGTNIVLDSLKYIKSKVRFIIYTQHEIDRDIVYGKNVKLEIRSMDAENYWDLYQEGDVLVLPRKYGGLSLQLNEAMSAGFIPLMPNCGPQNTFLNPYMMTPVTSERKIQLRPAEPITCYEVDPKSLACHIDLMHGMNKNKIEELSEYSNMYATLISWENLGPKYMRLFASL